MFFAFFKKFLKKYEKLLDMPPPHDVIMKAIELKTSIFKYDFVPNQSKSLNELFKIV